MIKNLQSVILSTKENNNLYKPQFFRLKNETDKEKFLELIRERPFLRVFDEIISQLEELVKSLTPKTVFKKDELRIAAIQYLGNTNSDDYGVWVFYPWSNTIVHLLDEDEFVKVRTNRNQYKITPEEKEILSTKRVGIIGLSVGQSVALTIAMERSAGELRIADFDILELSNLNRIRTGVHNFGISKVTCVAREIAEIDPFLKVTCFHEGINENNIEDFFCGNGNLNAVIEECDSLNIKILCREYARKKKIPVIMDTSDRGMIDVERFDLEIGRPIFHGLLDNYNLDHLNDRPELKMELIYAILDKDKISERFRRSIEEIGKTLTTWPQLASAVVAGGANAADVYRRIMLDFPISSGRYYIDLEEIVR